MLPNECEMRTKERNSRALSDGPRKKKKKKKSLLCHSCLFHFWSLLSFVFGGLCLFDCVLYFKGAPSGKRIVDAHERWMHKTKPILWRDTCSRSLPLLDFLSEAQYVIIIQAGITWKQLWRISTPFAPEKTFPGSRMMSIISTLHVKTMMSTLLHSTRREFKVIIVMIRRGTIRVHSNLSSSSSTSHTTNFWPCFPNTGSSDLVTGAFLAANSGTLLPRVW